MTVGFDIANAYIITEVAKAEVFSPRTCNIRRWKDCKNPYNNIDKWMRRTNNFSGNTQNQIPILFHDQTPYHVHRYRQGS